MNSLLLASKSPSRRYLLNQAQIPFNIIDQNADEKSIAWNIPAFELVTQLAQLKMAHAQLPQSNEGEICFVLTADTVGTDTNGTIYGKPENLIEAINILRALKYAQIYTGYCLEKKIFKSNNWHVLERRTEAVVSSCSFEVPDFWLDSYFSNTPSLEAAGAIAIEGYGLQFLKTVNGSYTSILGLPLFEVRQALEELAFFTKI